MNNGSVLSQQMIAKPSTACTMQQRPNAIFSKDGPKTALSLTQSNATPNMDKIKSIYTPQ